MNSENPLIKSFVVTYAQSNESDLRRWANKPAKARHFNSTALISNVLVYCYGGEETWDNLSHTEEILHRSVNLKLFPRLWTSQKFRGSVMHYWKVFPDVLLSWPSIKVQQTKSFIMMEPRHKHQQLLSVNIYVVFNRKARAKTLNAQTDGKINYGIFLCGNFEARNHEDYKNFKDRSVRSRKHEIKDLWFKMPLPCESIETNHNFLFVSRSCKEFTAIAVEMGKENYFYFNFTLGHKIHQLSALDGEYWKLICSNMWLFWSFFYDRDNYVELELPAWIWRKLPEGFRYWWSWKFRVFKQAFS